MKKILATSIIAASFVLPVAAYAAGPIGYLTTANPATSAPWGYQETYTNNYGYCDQVSAKCTATKGSASNTTNWVTRTNATYANSGKVYGPSYWASGTYFEGHSQVYDNGSVVYDAYASRQF